MDKLRKENTVLYDMTNKLKNNFNETDKVYKKIHHELRRAQLENEALAQENARIGEELALREEQERRRKASAKRPANPQEHNPEHPDTLIIHS
jgi:septal ring factor EnvC (AmiA/AmiB activator)